MPTKNSGKWSKKEVRLLEEGIEKFGRKWVKVSEFVQTRSNSQCYNHYKWLQSSIKNQSKSVRNRSRSKSKNNSRKKRTASIDKKNSKKRTQNNKMRGSSSTPSDDEDVNDMTSLLTGEIELGTVSPRQRHHSKPRKGTKKYKNGVPNFKLDNVEEGPDLTGDYFNIALLLLLYTLQGIPMGLTQAVSLILSSNNVSLSKNLMFSLVSLPFSLKLAWAPIVDSVFIPAFGRRKTWLIPTQLIIAGTIIYSATSIDRWIEPDVVSGGITDVDKLTIIFFLLFSMCATQDICVDGWALTLLKKRNVGYAATCNSIGQLFGTSLAFIGWNALHTYTDVSFGSFMMVFGIVFATVTIGIMLFVAEKEVSVENEPPTSIKVYKEMWDIVQIPLVQQLIVLLMTCKFGFASESMSQIMMTGTIGIPQSDWFFLQLMLTPLSLIIPKLIETYTAGARPFNVFMQGVLPRIGLCFIAALLYLYAPSSFSDDICNQWTTEYTCGVDEEHGCVWNLTNGSTTCSSTKVPSLFFFNLIPNRVWMHRIWYAVFILTAMAVLCLQSAMFVAQMSLFAKVSDPRIGGTYMTLLNTFANLGNFVSTRSFGYVTDQVDKYMAGEDECSKLMDENSCTSFVVSESVTTNGCNWVLKENTCTGIDWKEKTDKHEGFYITMVLFSLFGIIWVKYNFERAQKLQDRPLKDWHVQRASR